MQGEVVRCKRALYAAAPTFRGGSESQTHPKGLPSTWEHPTVHGQRHLPVGSLGLGAFPVAIGFGHRGNESGGGIGKLKVTTRLWSWALHTPSGGTPGAMAQRRLALRCETYMPRGINTAPPSGWNQALVTQRRQVNKSEAVTKDTQARCGPSSRRRNLSAIQDTVRSDNLSNLTINAAPYNRWRFSGDPITTRNDLGRMAQQRREDNRCSRSGSRAEQPKPKCKARSSAANARCTRPL